MTEKEFIDFFVSLFDELSEPIEMETEFRYLDEWSSMTGLAFITDMEQKYNKKFSVDQFKAAETLQDLYNTFLSL